MKRFNGNKHIWEIIETLKETNKKQYILFSSKKEAIRYINEHKKVDSNFNNWYLDKISKELYHIKNAENENTILHWLHKRKLNPYYIT